MDQIIATGDVRAPDGSPLSGHPLVLQGFETNEWTKLGEITGGEFQIEVPVRVLTPRAPKASVMPLRIVDLTDLTPQVVSDGPMLVLDGTVLRADFGVIRLLEEPYHRKGHSVDGELVIGAHGELAEGEAERQKLTSDLHSRLAAMQTDLESARGDLQARARQLDDQRSQLSDALSQWNQSKQRLSENETELSRVRAELASATDELNRLAKTAGTPAKVLDVLAGLGSQLSAASETLAEQRIPFRLSDVKVNLRGRLSNGGDMISIGESVDGGGISASLVTDAPAPNVPTREVPNVLGLTESAAGRVLRSVGFRMNAATQLLAKGAGVPGQAVAQHPAAGQPTEFGASVLVVFGIRSQEND